MGIGKRALMEDYYIDEVGEVMAQWARLHGVEPDGEGVSPSGSGCSSSLR